MNSKLIYIAGPSGVGKSTTSKRLSEKLNIIHRFGSGFIREIAKSFIDEIECKELYSYSFDAVEYDAPVQADEVLVRQSLPLRDPINRMANRALTEGSDIIIEGVNLIPGLTEHPQAHRFFLHNSNEELHFRMIHGDTHKNRLVDKNSFQRVRLIQKALHLRALAAGWHCIDVAEMQAVECIASFIEEG